jgi:hypothetical protein
MSTIFGDIRFARGLEENLPSLEEGKPALTTDTKRVFVGSDEGNVEIAKKSDVDIKTTVIQQDTPPANAEVGDFWLDTSDNAFQGTEFEQTFSEKMTIVTLVSYNGVTQKFKNETTTLYVDIDSNVVSGNNGLSIDKPIKLSDVVTIFNALKTDFPILMGTWTIQLNGGTYQSDGLNHMFFLADIRSQNTIEFKGANVTTIGDIPTTVLDGKINGTQYMHGMYFQNIDVKISNIKFQNFTEGTTPNIPTGTRGGLVFSGTTGKIVAYNVHTYNCSWGGIVNQGIPRMYVQGGKFEYCRYGIVSMFNTTVTIGYNGSSSFPDSQNTQIINCTESGVMLQSQTNGHVDYCVFDGNTNRSLTITTSSEVNGVNDIFRNNNIAVSGQTNSRFLNSGCTFTNNTQDYETFASGEVEQSSNTTFRKRNVGSLIETAANFINTAPSGGGVLLSQSIPASSLFGRGKTLEFIMFGRVINAGTNTCVLNIKAVDSAAIPNTVTLQSINIGSVAAFQGWHLQMFLSNYTSAAFYFNSVWNNQLTGNIVYNNNTVVLDSKTDITLTFELVVTGTAANTTFNTYRVIQRVTL